MFETCCPQCKKPLNGAAHRLVKDACGHAKCRLCLLRDEDQCNQCQGTNGHSVIRNTNKGVITCNGTPKTEPTPLCNGNDTDNGAVKTASGRNVAEKRKYESVVIPEHVQVIVKEPVPQYRCTKCDKVFATKAHIKYHVFCMGAKKPFNCSICTKDFITRSHYDAHMTKHAAMKPYQCDQCQKTFAEKSKLKRHTFLHSATKPYMCSLCGKTFRSKESVKLHTLIHRQEKPHMCHVCNARFSNTSNLNRHLITHSSDKVHMCDECGKTFKLKWSLSLHQKAHHQAKSQRPFSCATCSKTFVHNKDLQRHRLVHLGSRLEEFPFLTNAKLRLFQEAGTSYECTVCGTAFRRKDNLYRHVKNAHPGRKAELHMTTVVKDVKCQKQAAAEKKVKSKESKPHKIQDNPNAIKVITASPAFRNRVDMTTAAASTAHVADKTVINGPLKLAFKTNAFKNNYNIQRTYDMAESVEICQKILSPATEVIRKTSTSDNVTFSQKMLTAASTPSCSRYETSFEHPKHAVIKNIKFKLPPNYTNLRAMTGDTFKDVMPLKPVIGHLGESPKSDELTELRSVIVNHHHQNQQQQDHWRRRTWQNLKIVDN